MTQKNEELYNEIIKKIYQIFHPTETSLQQKYFNRLPDSTMNFSTYCSNIMLNNLPYDIINKLINNLSNNNIKKNYLYEKFYIELLNYKMLNINYNIEKKSYDIAFKILNNNLNFMSSYFTPNFRSLLYFSHNIVSNYQCSLALLQNDYNLLEKNKNFEEEDKKNFKLNQYQNDNNKNSSMQESNLLDKTLNKLSLDYFQHDYRLLGTHVPVENISPYNILRFCEIIYNLLLTNQTIFKTSSKFFLLNTPISSSTFDSPIFNINNSIKSTLNINNSEIFSNLSLSNNISNSIKNFSDSILISKNLVELLNRYLEYNTKYTNNNNISKIHPLILASLSSYKRKFSFFNTSGENFIKDITKNSLNYYDELKVGELKDLIDETFLETKASNSVELFETILTKLYEDEENEKIKLNNNDKNELKNFKLISNNIINFPIQKIIEKYSFQPIYLNNNLRGKIFNKLLLNYYNEENEKFNKEDKNKNLLNFLLKLNHWRLTKEFYTNDFYQLIFNHIQTLDHSSYPVYFNLLNKLRITSSDLVEYSNEKNNEKEIDIFLNSMKNYLLDDKLRFVYLFPFFCTNLLSKNDKIFNFYKESCLNYYKSCSNSSNNFFSIQLGISLISDENLLKNIIEEEHQEELNQNNQNNNENNNDNISKNNFYQYLRPLNLNSAFNLEIQAYYSNHFTRFINRNLSNLLESKIYISVHSNNKRIDLIVSNPDIFIKPYIFLFGLSSEISSPYYNQTSTTTLSSNSTSSSNSNSNSSRLVNPTFSPSEIFLPSSLPYTRTFIQSCGFEDSNQSFEIIPCSSFHFDVLDSKTIQIIEQTLLAHLK